MRAPRLLPHDRTRRSRRRPRPTPASAWRTCSQRATPSTPSTSSGSRRWASSGATGCAVSAATASGRKSPERCQFCLSDRLAYMEVPLKRKQILIEGHADAAVHTRWYRGLIEVKSIGIRTLRFEAPRLYQQVPRTARRSRTCGGRSTAPSPAHLKQGQLYLWMAWPALRADLLHLRVEVPPADQRVHSHLQQEPHRTLARNGPCSNIGRRHRSAAASPVMGRGCGE